MTFYPQNRICIGGKLLRTHGVPSVKVKWKRLFMHFGSALRLGTCGVLGVRNYKKVQALAKIFFSGSGGHFSQM
jgi:hypothetical protein